MNFAGKLRAFFSKPIKPRSQIHGELGERAARKYLEQLRLKFIAANFKSKRGEIDLIFRDEDCLVFVEVKARSSEKWVRPARTVHAYKKRLLSQTALDYLKLAKNPQVKVRFDIVEVLLESGEVREVRHLPNCFPMSGRYRYL